MSKGRKRGADLAQDRLKAAVLPFLLVMPKWQLAIALVDLACQFGGVSADVPEAASLRAKLGLAP